MRLWLAAKLANVHIPISKVIPAHTHVFTGIIQHNDLMAPIDIQYLLKRNLNVNTQYTVNIYWYKTIEANVNTDEIPNTCKYF